MAQFLKKFFKDQNGAVSVEWVVLTAGIVGLSISAFSVIENNNQTLANNVGATVEAWDTTAVSGETGVSGE